VRRPQDVVLRKALIQVHHWTGLGVGLYNFVITHTGSILVYRNELYRYYSPRPVIVEGAGQPMTPEALKIAASRAYPGYEIGEPKAGDVPNQALEIELSRGDDSIRRLFHPFTGEDLGHPLPAGYRFTSWLLDLHDNLLGGETGRRINGIGALLLTLLCATGAVIWWPGSRNWRGSLFLDRRASWKRFNWSLHSVLGFWLFGFLVIWGVSGMYLSYPDPFMTAFDAIEPFDENNPAERVVDRIQYWIAYLHFGRLGGRGIPGCGRGLCDSITKATWAVLGLVPPILFVTGAVMWWNRVLGPRRRRTIAGAES
jgi:uncharacterized iron-regulated membrane protein